MSREHSETVHRESFVECEDTFRLSDASARAVLRKGVLVALVVSLSVPLLDLLLATDEFDRLSTATIFIPAAVLAGSVLATFAVVSLVVVAPLIRFTRLQPTALLLSMAALVATPPLLRRLGWQQALSTEAPALGIALGLAAAASVFLALTSVDRPSGRENLGLRMSLSLPFALLTTLGAQWMCERTFGTPPSPVPLVVLLLLVGVASRLVGTARRSLWGLSALAAVLIGGSVLSLIPEGRPVAKVRPGSVSTAGVRHVVLLTIDALRWDALSCYGGEVRTPHIDRLAADGLLFHRGYSMAPWTLPAFSSLMTGLSPATHGVQNVSQRLPGRLPTLAQRLSHAGYTTAGIGHNWFLTPRGSRRTMDRGFDHYDFYPKKKPPTLAVELTLHLFPDILGLYASTDELTRLAVDWMELHRQDPFFLWLHYFDPHIPYEPPEAFFPQGRPHHAVGRSYGSDQIRDVRNGKLRISPKLRKWVRALYHGEVRFVDDEVGKLVAALKRLGIYEAALVILTSDHGDEHFEHGGTDHGHSLYEELLRIPLIIKLPGSSGARRINSLVSTVDVAPTILELCEVGYDASRLEGASLSRLWDDEPDRRPADSIYSTGLLRFADREAVVFRNYKYIRFQSWLREELYDLRRDPHEQNNLAPWNPELLERGRSLLESHHAESKRVRSLHRLRGPAPSAPLAEEHLQALRALGYVPEAQTGRPDR